MDRAFRLGIGQKVDVRVVMDVDKAGGDGQAAGIDHSDASARSNAPDISYRIAGYADVRRKAGTAKPVKDEAVFDDQVIVLIR